MDGNENVHREEKANDSCGFEKFTFKQENFRKDESESTFSFASELDEKAKSRSRSDTEYESDQGYRRITESIIKISGDYLKDQIKCKKPLRSRFFWLFAVLLSVQYVCLVLFIMFDSFTGFPFSIAPEILHLYTISVFVETLSAMAVMIAFAFAATDERKIVKVLNTIVEKYQKVSLDQLNDDSNAAKKNKYP